MNTEKPSTGQAESSSVALAGSPSEKAAGKSTIADPSSVWSSIPPIGAYRTEDHFYYMNGKGPQVSVTTVLKVLDKPAVVTWAKKEVARHILSNFAHYQERYQAGASLDDMIAEAIRIPDAQKDMAGKLGSGVHYLADMASRSPQDGSGGFEIPSEYIPYLNGFTAFLDALSASGAQIVSSEKMVWSHQGYAGTYDLLIEYPDGLWLLDIKTSKGFYPEYALQLAAYGYADWIIVEGNPVPYSMPSIKGYGVLHLRPDQYPEGYKVIPYPVEERDYVAFLGALEVSNWKSEGRFTKSNLLKSKHVGD